MKIEVVGVADDCCSARSRSSSSEPLARESALRVAPLSSTVYSCCRMRWVEARCDW